MLERVLHSEDILQEVARLKAERAREHLSITEASSHVPELLAQMRDLLGYPPPEPPLTEEQEEQRRQAFKDSLKKPSKKITNEESRGLLDRVHASIMAHFVPNIVSFDIPIEDDTVQVSVAHGRGRDGYNRMPDDSYDVTVNEAGYKLVIADGKARVESIARDTEPFTMHTPIGPARSWPVWSRAMNMQDYTRFSGLLNRLKEPDVIRVPIK